MSRILTPEQIDTAQKLILNAGRIIISTHKSPDGDAIGSALAMHHFLVSLGKNPTTILPDAAPDFLHWVKDYDQCIVADIQPEKAAASIASADLIFSLDYNQLSRTGDAVCAMLQQCTAPIILIDHHQQPGDFPRVTYSDTGACSTCEMVFRFIEQCGWKGHMNLDIATCIYLGIMTDSGSFRYHTVSFDTHRIAGELIALGLDHADIHRSVYDTNLMDKLKLIGYALSEKLVVLHEHSTAFISLEKEELLRYNYRQGDTEGLVNQALSIRGIKFAAFFREGTNEIKSSFRSKGSFDVNSFSRAHWQGGGHINAAGGISNETMEATLLKFRDLTLRYSNQINAS
ncbi:MAG: DHH family phosphoesterase [Flavobacteriales bacterium]